MSNNTTRAAGPGGIGGVGGDAYPLAYTGAEIDAAISGWQTAKSQTDATAADIAQGKKAITSAGLVTGTMDAGGGSYDPTDPMSVYKATRPADWLPMPEPAEGEAYMLYMVPPTDQAIFAVQATFAGSATIQLGDATPIALTSGIAFETTFDWNTCTNPTSDGFRQVLIKISGNHITELSFADHSLKSSYTDYPVLDFSGNLPEATSVKAANKRTRYFSLSKSSITNMSNMFQTCYSIVAILSIDTNKAIDMYRMFYGCYSLAAVPSIDTSQTTRMSYMFCDCRSLTTIPAIDTSQATSTNNMFYNCYSLATIPAIDTGRVTNASSMFQGCCSLVTIPAIDTSQVTNASSMFSGCYSLTTIPAIDTSQVISMSYMFSGCYSLTTIPAIDTSKSSSTTNIFSSCRSLSKILYGPSKAIEKTQTLSLLDCVLSRKAIVEFFHTLPTAVGSSPKLTLSQNPGVPDLTDEDKAIAAGKGWTLTL